MTKEALFDFLLFHAYSKLGGFLINVLGLAVAFLGIIMFVSGRTETIGVVSYLCASFAFLAYTPIQLKVRAAKQIQVNPKYCRPVEYTFLEEEGIIVEWDGEKRAHSWDEILRAVVTPKTIGIYYKEEEAMIIPKTDFGDQFGEIFQMIARHLGMNRLRMR